MSSDDQKGSKKYGCLRVPDAANGDAGVDGALALGSSGEAAGSEEVSWRCSAVGSGYVAVSSKALTSTLYSELQSKLTGIKVLCGVNFFEGGADQS